MGAVTFTSQVATSTTGSNDDFSSSTSIECAMLALETLPPQQADALFSEHEMDASELQRFADDLAAVKRAALNWDTPSEQADRLVNLHDEVISQLATKLDDSTRARVYEVLSAEDKAALVNALEQKAEVPHRSGRGGSLGLKEQPTSPTEDLQKGAAVIGVGGFLIGALWYLSGL